MFLRPALRFSQGKAKQQSEKEQSRHSRHINRKSTLRRLLLACFFTGDIWSKRLGMSSSLAVDLDDAPGPQDVVATTAEYKRQDKFGGLWRGRPEPLRERRLADMMQ